MASQIHVGDTGTSFKITLRDQDDAIMDLTVASIIDIDVVFKKPDATTLTKTASFVTDGTDGKVKYVTGSSDLDAPGKWSIQVFVNTTDGPWHSDITKFDVKANLK